jgi:predicted branched-subunit amino acid permease
LGRMKHGAFAILPLAAGAAVYGVAFGLLAGGAVLGAAFAGAALNLRYIGIIASLSEVLKGLPLRVRLMAIHITGDENWALTMAKRAQDPGVGFRFLIGSGLVMITVWTVSTSLGAVIGAALPDLEKFGLGFAFTAAFIAMARGLWRSHAQLLPWVTSFAVTGAVVLLEAPKAYAIVAGAIAGLIASYLIRQIGAGQR